MKGGGQSRGQTADFYFSDAWYTPKKGLPFSSPARFLELYLSRQRKAPADQRPHRLGDKTIKTNARKEKVERSFNFFWAKEPRHLEKTPQPKSATPVDARVWFRQGKNCGLLRTLTPNNSSLVSVKALFLRSVKANFRSVKNVNP